MQITHILRPQILEFVVDMTAGEFDSTFHEVGAEAHLAYSGHVGGLLIGIDVHSDGTEVIRRGIRFTDYTGLSQEWLDGTSAIILNNTLQSIVNDARSSKAAFDSTNPAVPNTYQRAQVVGKSYTPSLS